MDFRDAPMSGSDASNDVTEVRRRRAWSIRSNAARKIPSQFGTGVPYNESGGDLEELELLERMRLAPQSDVDGRADVIVREMEQDAELMLDNPQSEELRKEALRELPQCLTMKRTIRAKISASVSMKSKRKPLSVVKRFKYRLSFAMKRLRQRSKDFIFSTELWYNAIRTIEGHFGSAVGSYFHFLRYLFVVNSLLSLFLVCFVVLPQVLHDQRVGGNETVRYAGSNVFIDFLSGKGVFEDTILFYGHYQTGTIKDASYDMTYAYFFTMSVLLVAFFILLSVRTAWSYQRHFIETAGGVGQLFAGKVFCGWDFGIATRTAAANNSRNIYNEFKELLSELDDQKRELTLCDKVTRVSADVAVNILVVGLTGGTLVLFWWLQGRGDDSDPYWPLGLALLVTFVLTSAPILFTRLARLESYSKRTSLYVTLARSFILDASTLLLFLLYWLRRDMDCWETMLGQEIYRLVILDIIFSVILIPLIEYMRSVAFSVLLPEHLVELDPAYNSLCLVYNQALLWLGVIFSPPLAVIVSIKMAATFYVKKFIVMRACQPPREVWRAARTQTALHLLVYLSLLGALCVLGFVVMRSTSQQCGPFQQYRRVYEVLTEGVLGLSRRPLLRRVLNLVTRPAAVGLLLVFMSAGVYYLKARATAQRDTVALLRDMLVLEARDKEFLLHAIGKVANGEWHYKRRGRAEQSATWRYLEDEAVRRPSNADYQLAGAARH